MKCLFLLILRLKTYQTNAIYRNRNIRIKQFIHVANIYIGRVPRDQVLSSTHFSSTLYSDVYVIGAFLGDNVKKKKKKLSDYQAKRNAGNSTKNSFNIFNSPQYPLCEIHFDLHKDRLTATFTDFRAASNFSAIDDRYI